MDGLPGSGHWRAINKHPGRRFAIGKIVVFVKRRQLRFQLIDHRGRNIVVWVNNERGDIIGAEEEQGISVFSRVEIVDFLFSANRTFVSVSPSENVVKETPRTVDIVSRKGGQRRGIRLQPNRFSWNNGLSRMALR